MEGDRGDIGELTERLRLLEAGLGVPAEPDPWRDPTKLPSPFRWDDGKDVGWSLQAGGHDGGQQPPDRSSPGTRV